jgi:hypothetical protein
MRRRHLTLSERRNIADEAHRSQHNFIDGLTLPLRTVARKSFPENALRGDFFGLGDDVRVTLGESSGLLAMK